MALTLAYDWVAGFLTFPTGALKAAGITAVAVSMYNETTRVVVATGKAATKSADNVHWYYAPASLAAGELALITDGDTVRATFTATTADTDIMTTVTEDRLTFDAAVLSRLASGDYTPPPAGLTAQQVWEYVERTITSGGITAQEVWEYVERTITSGGITEEEVRAQADAALVAYDGPTRTEATADTAEVIDALPDVTGLATAEAVQDVQDGVDAIAAQLTGVSVSVTSPLSSDGGTMTIKRGNSYGQEEGEGPITYTQHGIDLTGAEGVWTRGELEVALVITVISPTEAAVELALTNAETADIGRGEYTYTYTWPSDLLAQHIRTGILLVQ